MTTTSVSLGEHWEEFVRREVESGRYGSASEVVRAALREPEDRSKRLSALRAHLDQGARETKRGAFVEFSVDDVMSRAKKPAKN